eukprot:CAMPEP_0202726528 /NCGR_PEP_ID=MMETSP1385-20130828/184657_1 /ASSEMBLY_ACC=CAM_ASM_000861 /TAXON_ID=933848 /ORGANISM="Elphidium margaritaceum" /LENGTH=234 /DNA_ID=CAMNT_0049392749 /DNA_START=195 /DNA_END=899 /DNA_ORIENTATION=+
MNIQSSKGSLNDTVLSRRDDESSEHFASVYGAFRIDAKLKARRVRWKLKVIESCCMRIGITADKADCDNVLSVNGHHRFHTLNDSGQLRCHRSQVSLGEMNIFKNNDIVEIWLSLDDDKADCDNVLSVNGHHRFHTLNDSGQLRCHRSQVSLGEMNIFKNNDIVEIWLSLDDDDSATILFMVSYTGDDGEHELPVVVTQKVNLCSEYRLVVFMSKHYGTHPHGQVQLLDFAIDQ